MWTDWSSPAVMRLLPSAVVAGDGEVLTAVRPGVQS
jgi:hypothetical protein